MYASFEWSNAGAVGGQPEGCGDAHGVKPGKMHPAICFTFPKENKIALDWNTPLGYKVLMELKTKQKCLDRLSRIEGQVRGVARMIEDNRYCIDVITQIAAAQAALRKVEEELLRNHVNHCVQNAIASGNAEDQRRKVTELIEVLTRKAR